MKVSKVYIGVIFLIICSFVIIRLVDPLVKYEKITSYYTCNGSTIYRNVYKGYFDYLYEFSRYPNFEESYIVLRSKGGLSNGTFAVQIQIYKDSTLFFIESANIVELNNSHNDIIVYFPESLPDIGDCSSVFLTTGIEDEFQILDTTTVYCVK